MLSMKSYNFIIDCKGLGVCCNIPLHIIISNFLLLINFVKSAFIRVRLFISLISLEFDYLYNENTTQELIPHTLELLSKYGKK